MSKTMNKPGVEKNGWRIIGPGGGGAQYIPTISPHDPDMVLVACDMTGSYITYNGGQQWTQLNFKVFTGSFAFDPLDPDIVYAGATGLYRSEDRGHKWRLILPSPSSVTREYTIGDHAEYYFETNTDWPGGKVEAVTVDPSDSKSIFAVLNASKKRAVGTSSGNTHIFHSSDFGQSWKELAQIQSGSFTKLFINQASPVENREIFIFTNHAIYRSNMQGFDPKMISRPAEDREIIDAAWGLDPVSHEPVLYLVTPSIATPESLDTGVYRSDDKGASWIPLFSGLDADRAPDQERNFTRIVTCETNANIVYLSATEPMSERKSDAEYFFGIFKSVDKGNSWSWSLRTGDKNPDNRELGWVEKDFTTGWGGAPFNMGVSPSNPDICYASDWGTTYRTIDGGLTWKQVYCTAHPDGTYSTRGLDVTNIYGIHFDPFDKDHLAISCTDIGLFESYNGGHSWKHALNGVPRGWSNTCYWVVFDPEVKGRAWSVWSGCHDMPRPKMFTRNRFSKYPGGVCKTDDSMATWRKSNEGMPENCIATHIVLDPKSPAGSRTLYVAGFDKGVFKSTDDGNTWIMKNNGLSGNFNAWKLLLLPDGTLYLLVARGLKDGQVLDGAIYKSTDGAESWHKTAMPHGVNFPNFMDFDPEAPERMYLACWPRVIDGEEHHGGLYITEDGGATWRNVYDESSHVYAVAVDRKNPSTVYMSTFEGSAFRSDNRGEDWKRLGGYSFKWAKVPIPDPYNSDMLYITTFGSSVWYGPSSGVDGAFEDIYPLK